MSASIWQAGADRLAAFQRYRILDRQPEDCFDTITRLTAQFFRSPIAWISLVDRNRSWFKSVFGLNLSERPGAETFCAHTISTSAPLVVQDATADARFADNPVVTGEPHIRFYAGVPLQTPEGVNIGALCVVDSKPRECTDQQLRSLQELASLVLLQLEARLLQLDADAARPKDTQASPTGSSSSDNSEGDPLLAAAHHIRTPLNGIFAAADLLALTELTPEQREYLEIVRASSHNLLKLAAETLKEFEGTKRRSRVACPQLRYKHVLA
jgi:signal transduction histidine kinase